jgi:hypothetical protein
MPNKIPISLYVSAIIATILLAPYAGCHIFTRPANPTMYSDSQDSLSPNTTTDPAGASGSLVDLEQLLNK